LGEKVDGWESPRSIVSEEWQNRDPREDTVVEGGRSRGTAAISLIGRKRQKRPRCMTAKKSPGGGGVLALECFREVGGGGKGKMGRKGRFLHTRANCGGKLRPGHGVL